MSLKFQPKIIIKAKDIALLAVIITLLLGGVAFASANEIGIPQEIKEKLDKNVPVEWGGSGGGSGSGSSTEKAPARTHDASEFKVVFRGEVMTLQEALSSLEKDLEDVDKKLNKINN